MRMSIFGSPATMMQIGARQLALRNPENKGKSTYALKSVPPFILTDARANYLKKFVPAMIARRGKSLESNVAFVKSNFTGKDFGGKANAKLRLNARYARANALASALKSGRVLLT